MFGSKKYTEPKVTYIIVEDIDEELISVEEAKDFMQIDFPDFDSTIEMIISAAREEAEKYTGLSIGLRTIQLAGEWEKEDAYMPFAPVLYTSETGEQEVGYSKKGEPGINLPGDLKLALLNMIHIAFENRTTGLNFATSLKLLDRSRRRVGL